MNASTDKNLQGVNSMRALNRVLGEVSKTDLFQIDPTLIKEEPGFNVRDAEDPEYWDRPHVLAHIRGFAESYKSGRFVPPMTVKVKDGVPYLRAGSHRLRGVLLALSEGAQIKKLPVLEAGGDETTDAALLITENGGKPLAPLALASIYGRHKTWGWSIDEIASLVCKTHEHVRMTLRLLELPMDLKRKVNDETISASYALELYSAHGHAAVDMVNDFIAKAQVETPSEGGKKTGRVTITKSKLEKGPAITKKFATQLHTSFVSLTARISAAQRTEKGTFTVELSEQEMDQLMEIKAALEPKAAKSSEVQLPLLE